MLVAVYVYHTSIGLVAATVHPPVVSAPAPEPVAEPDASRRASSILPPAQLAAEVSVKGVAQLLLPGCALAEKETLKKIRSQMVEAISFIRYVFIAIETYGRLVDLD